MTVMTKQAELTMKRLQQKAQPVGTHCISPSQYSTGIMLTHAVTSCCTVCLKHSALCNLAATTFVSLVAVFHTMLNACIT